jgi:predicted O-methyltransferase YrrM
MTEPRPLEELLASIRSFQECRTLLTALELDLFTVTAFGASAGEVAAARGADPRAMEMLLNALVALGALAKRDDRFSCTASSLALGPARAGLLHTVNRWHTWSSLTACVQSGSTQVQPGERGPEWTEAFIQAMAARARVQAPETVRLVGCDGVGRMLDLGGGPGIFALAFASANPHLRAEILDLPEVVPMARRNIEEAGLGGQVTARAGDLREPLPAAAYDLILVSAICHMLDEQDNRALFGRLAQGLAPGGRVVIRDFLMDDDRTSPRDGALFALNMLVGTRAGSTYTEAEYRLWLAEAGLGAVTRPEGAELLLAARAT